MTKGGRIPMAPRGRAPTPTNLVHLRGNPGKRALPKDEPKPDLFTDSNVPTPPKNLDRIGAAEWKRLAAELCTLGLLSELDTTMLEVYCSNYAQYRQADNEVAKHFKEKKSYLVEYTNKAGKTNLVPHPSIRIRDNALQMMRSIGSEFGFTPSSRSRMKVTNPTGKKSGLSGLRERRSGVSG